MINFNDLFGSSSSDQPIIEPDRIFTTLSRESKFKRPSDEQGDVLDEWFKRRNESDLTVKMNTGAGKTLVGLLLLKSCLNEGKGPAVYLTPDNYLASQVASEARSLGIEVTANEDDPSFLRGESILVVNSRKLINGRSRFGIRTIEIPIGSVVVDDAHACLDDIKEQFSIKVDEKHDLYKSIFSILSHDLKSYNPILHSRLELGDPTAAFEVPYWFWKSRKNEIATALMKLQSNQDIQFNLPLVWPVLEFCQCVFTAKKIEIAPRYIPIDIIPSFTEADRKIYMTATLANDGILVSHLMANVAAIEEPIRPKGIGDMGTRMILAPLELNTDFIFEQLKKLAEEVAKERNVVVITPSNQASMKWKSVANQFLDKSNLHDGVEKMRKGRVGLTVMANKYDGIDLPFEACELLILDGAPEVDGEIEKLNSLALEGTKSSRINTVQKIEQGMGRGVRSPEDFCAVLLWGPKLTRIINIPQSFDHFTEITKIQLKIARSLTKQLAAEGAVIDEVKLKEVLRYSFEKNSEWRKGSKNEIARAQREKSAFVEDFLPKARQAFDFARKGGIDAACSLLQDAANKEEDDRTRGVILAQLAEIKYHQNPLESFGILSKASMLNPSVMKPLEGLQYKRLSAPENQAVACCKFLERFLGKEDLVLWIHDLVSDLAFNPQTTKRFEAAFKELGLWLGFGSHRPEYETGKGPDNLWAVGDKTFFVIECKSGAIGNSIVKADINQLSGSMNWFSEKYPPDCVATPVIVHQYNKSSPEAFPYAGTRVIDSAGMQLLLGNLVSLAKAISSGKLFEEADKIRDQLIHFQLTAGQFLPAYSKVVKH
jgi:hypothetical protein